MKKVKPAVDKLKHLIDGGVKLLDALKILESQNNWTLEDRVSVLRYVIRISYHNDNNSYCKDINDVLDILSDCVPYLKFDDFDPRICTSKHLKRDWYQLLINLIKHGYDLPRNHTNFDRNLSYRYYHCRDFAKFLISGMILNSAGVKDYSSGPTVTRKGVHIEDSSEEDSSEECESLDEEYPKKVITSRQMWQTLQDVPLKILSKNEDIFLSAVQKIMIYNNYDAKNICRSLPYDGFVTAWIAVRKEMTFDNMRTIIKNVFKFNNDKLRCLLGKMTDCSIPEEDLLSRVLINILPRIGLRPTHNRETVHYILMYSKDFVVDYTRFRSIVPDEGYNPINDLLKLLTTLSTKKRNKLILYFYIRKEIAIDEVLMLYFMGYGDMTLAITAIKSGEIDFDRFFDHATRRIAFTRGNFTNIYNSVDLLRDLKIEPTLSDLALSFSSKSLSNLVKGSIITDTNTLRYIESNGLNHNSKTISKATSKKVKLEAISRFYETLDPYTKFLMTQYIDGNDNASGGDWLDPFKKRFIYHYNPTISYEYLLEFAKIGNFDSIIRLVNISHYSYILDMLDHRIAMQCVDKLEMMWIMNYIHIRDFGTTVDGFEVDYIPIEPVNQFCQEVDESIKKLISPTQCMTIDLVRRKANSEKSNKLESITNVLDAQHPTNNILSIIDKDDYDPSTLSYDLKTGKIRTQSNKSIADIAERIIHAREKANRTLRGLDESDYDYDESDYEDEEDEEDEEDWTSDEEDWTSDDDY
jgi:hypothetical protein